MPSIPSDYGRIKPPNGARLDYNQPSTRGLVACYLFNEGTGNKALDSSQNGLHGVVDPTLTARRGSPYGPGFDFAKVVGSNNLPVSVPHNPLLTPSAALTVRALVYLVGTTGNGEGKIVAKEDASPTHISYIIQQNAATTGRLGFVSGTVGVNYSTSNYAVVSTNPTMNAWHDLVGTNDGQNIKFYVDGVFQATVSVPGLIYQAVNPLGIGQSFQYGGGPFSGLIAGVWLYDRALSANEIAFLYAQPFAMVAQPLALTLQTFGLGIPSVTGFSPLATGALLSTSGLLVPANITAGTSFVQSGATLASAGVAAPASKTGSAALQSGLAFSSSGTTAPAAVTGSHAFAPGTSLTTSGSFGNSVSGSASFQSGAALASARSVAPAALSGTHTLQSGAALSALGVTSPSNKAGTAAFTPGASLSAAGATNPANSTGSSTFQSGLALSTTSSVGNSVTGSAPFQAGAALSAVGVATPVIVVGFSNLQSGASFQVVGLPAPANTSGSHAVLAGAVLASTGIVSPAGTSGATLFQSGATLQSNGVAIAPNAPMTFTTGASLQAAGTLTFVQNYVATRAGTVMPVWYGSIKVSISGSL